MGHLGIVKKRAAWATLLEAAYDPVPDDGTWGEQILGVARDAFETRFGTALYAVQHDAECTTVQTLVDCRTGALAQGRQSITPAALGLIGADAFRAFHYPPLMVTTHSEIEPALEPGLREVLRRERKGADAADVVGIVVHPEPGVALVLCSVLERELSLAKHERHLLAKLGLHLAAAFRLRRRPESVCAVISLDGRILEGGGLGGGDHVARQVLQIEGSRSKAQGDDLIDLWTALIAGRYSLVPRTENGRRLYLVLENSLPSRDLRALTAREVDVLSMASRGLSSKLVGYGLGISPAAVSIALAGAASKLGVSSRLELVRLAAIIGGDPRACASSLTVTAAESDILALLEQGMSNHEIACLRARSVRTIANQVASLLRKTKSASRAALVAAGARGS